MKVADAAVMLRELSEPWPSDTLVRDAIRRTMKWTGFAYWRSSDIWYEKARRIEEFERDAILEAQIKKRREATRNELHDLRTRLAILESRLAQQDSEFHRESIDHLREQAGGLVRAPSRSRLTRT